MSDLLQIITIVICTSLVLNNSCSNAWLFKKSGGTSNHGSAPRSHDIGSQTALNSLYNSRVVEARRVERPLTGWSFKAGPFKHEGVVVKTETGKEWLVHKGPDFGTKSQTVVTDARHMSDKWETTGRKSVSSGNVGDYVRQGGTNYNLLKDNCQHGAGRMWGKNNRRRRCA